MQEFILGYPINLKPVFSSITRYSNLQDAASGCSDYVAIYAINLDAAKDKFNELAAKNFQK